MPVTIISQEHRQEHRPKGVVFLNKKVLVGLALVILVGVAGVAAAAPKGDRIGGFGGTFFGFGGFGAPGKGMNGAPEQGIANMISELNLTDEQIAQIRKINADAFQKIQGLQNSLSQKVFEMRDMCWQKEPDQDAIAAKRDEIKGLREQIVEIQRQAREDQKNVLTEEQQEALSQSRVQGPGKRGRRGAGHGRANLTPAPGGAGTTSN